jgi:hypothetical protein
MGTFQSTATTSGLGLEVDTSGTFTYDFYRVRIQQAAAGTDQYYEGTAAAVNTAITSASVAATNTPYLWEIEGFFQPSTNTTIQPAFRPETNGQTATLRAGSLGILTEIG